MQTTISKPKRSVKLLPSEVNKINLLIEQNGWFKTSFMLQVERGTLARVIGVGSGAEKTVNKIREYFKNQS